MSRFILHHLLNNTFLLNADRTIYWQEEKTLILSDLHFGKSGHFRKSGIGIPQNIFKEDMQRLFAAVQFFNPLQIIIVGDFFHSDINKEANFFLKWRNDFEHLTIHLIRGNHDVLQKQWYQQASLILHQDIFIQNNFCFVHDINDITEKDDRYCFCGHLHPGISIRGKAKQTIHLPCFYFTKKYAVLPAFGNFTGSVSIRPLKGEQVYAIAENNVIKIQ
ncbi:MAG: ligase-associated DNA damage response endonuclease PdeM [Bacteroidetes bacterium]|nr:ligase-associated DNA damage response endonuclease PdeM [Bacteroidota bacterium]MBS1758082.1 ligase-associated DNA damage response endonuclease PdeM [Bacteroidota bacterium]